jgi:hypothetical protein
MKAFTSKPTDVLKDVDFELDGKTYTFKPPKTSTQIVGMMQVKGKGFEADLERASVMLVWLSNGLSREHEPNPKKKYPGHEEYVEGCQSCDIKYRLEDPDDELELDTIMEVIAHLMEKVSGRPTT